MTKILSVAQKLCAASAALLVMSACGAATDEPADSQYLQIEPEQAADVKLDQAISELEQSAEEGDVSSRYLIDIRKRYPDVWDAFIQGARKEAVAGGTFYEIGIAGAQNMNAEILPIIRRSYMVASDSSAIEALNHVYDIYTYFEENDLEGCAHFAAGTDQGVQAVPSHLKVAERKILLRIWAEEDDTLKPIATDDEFGEWIQPHFIEKYPQHIDGVIAVGEIDKGDESARPICQAMIVLLGEVKSDPDAAKLARMLVAP